MKTQVQNNRLPDAHWDLFASVKFTVVVLIIQLSPKEKLEKTRKAMRLDK